MSSAADLKRKESSNKNSRYFRTYFTVVQKFTKSQRLTLIVHGVSRVALKHGGGGGKFTPPG